MSALHLRKGNFIMTKSRLVFASFCGVATLLVLMIVPGSVPAAGANHARWDIISLAFGVPPALNVASAGGFADATAPNNGGRIRLSGSGTFVAPASGGGS